MGHPILISNIFGCQGIFDGGISGMEFEPRNWGSLVSTIEDFINLPISEKDMDVEARKKVAKEFNCDIVVNKYFDQINSIYKGE